MAKERALLSRPEARRPTLIKAKRVGSIQTDDGEKHVLPWSLETDNGRMEGELEMGNAPSEWCTNLMLHRTELSAPPDPDTDGAEEPPCEASGQAEKGRYCPTCPKESKRRSPPPPENPERETQMSEPCS